MDRLRSFESDLQKSGKTLADMTPEDAQKSWKNSTEIVDYFCPKELRARISPIIKGGCLVMNKTELIAAVAEEAEMTKKDAEKAVKAVIDVISDALVQEIRFSSSVLVLSKFVNVVHVLVTILPLRRKSRFLHPKLRLSAYPNS